MKVQVTLVVNVDINRSDYAMEETSTDGLAGPVKTGTT